MAKSVLNVETRVRTGKGGSRKVRQDGLVPAVVYGKGVEALNLRLDPKALQKAVATEAGWNTLIETASSCTCRETSASWTSAGRFCSGLTVH